jgi:hexosaminidase
MGLDVVMSPTTHCYLDYKQTSQDAEPGAWFAPELTLETAYAYQPTPAVLSPTEAAHVLGVQGNIWTERMPTYKHVEYMTFPRLCALSEVAWSTSERDYGDFLLRLAGHKVVLDRFQVGYRGSPEASPVPPTDEERQQYLDACRHRLGASAKVAY